MDRRQAVSLLGRPVFSLSREDQFLFLCLHGVRHLWERLEWVCGISELVGSNAIPDWEIVLTRARATGLQRILFISLLLAELLTVTRVPAVLAERVERDRVAKKLASQAARRLLQGGDAVPEAGENFLYALQGYDRIEDKAQFLLFHLFTPKLADVAARPLPRPLRLLYTILRPFRVIPQYARSLAHAWLFARKEAGECLSNGRTGKM